MSSRAVLLSILFLRLTSVAERAPAPAAALQVQVYNYTDLSTEDLNQFVVRTQEILTRAGVSVEVDACPRGGTTPCESRRGSFRQVVIRVVAEGPPKNKSLRWQHLGQSIADRSGGAYATVYLKLAEEEAAEAELPRILVLSYAATHEVGHLLLGNDSHASEGLMKARWIDKDFQAMAQNRFHFSTGQSQELHRRFGAGRTEEIGADNLIAASH
jgi:hypothetical protein